jgi:hypothetical protein
MGTVEPTEQAREQCDLCKTEKKTEAVPKFGGMTVYHYETS